MFNRLRSGSVFRFEIPQNCVVALCCVLIWWKSLIVCHGCMFGIDVYRNGGAGKESDGWLWCGCQKPECLQLSDLSQAFSRQDEHDYIIMCAKWLRGASKWCIQELLFTVGNTEYTIEWPVQLHVLEINHIISLGNFNVDYYFLSFRFQTQPTCENTLSEPWKHETSF